MNNKKAILKLIKEYSFRLTHDSLNEIKETLNKNEFNKNEFIDFYNEVTLDNDLNNIRHLNIEMYISMKEMNFRVPNSIDNLLKYSFVPNRSWCEKLTDAVCKIGYPYFGHCLICVPYDGFWTNNIPYLLVADRNLVKELKDTTSSPCVEYCENGYLGHFNGRFCGLVPYLYKEKHYDLMNRVLDFIFGEYITCGEHMAFLTVNLLNFLKANQLDDWYKKIYQKFKEIQNIFDGVDWTNKMFFLSGISRHTLKDEIKELTIEEALRL